MRKRHWLAGLLSGWLSVVGGQALAQSPPPGVMVNPDMPGTVMPAPQGPAYGPMNYSMGPEAYTGMGSYPPGATAWPNISPYAQPGIDTTSNVGGLWFEKLITSNRKYYFTGEALIGFTNHPVSQVGAPGVNVVPTSVLFPGQILVDHTSQFLQTPFGTSLLGTPDRELSSSGVGGTGGTGGGATGGGTGVGSGVPANGLIPFGPYATDIISNFPAQPGVRGTWGWWNPDQSGFQVQAWWMERISGIGMPPGYGGLGQLASSAFDPQLFNSPGFNNTLLFNDLHAIAGIGLAGPDSDHDGLPGVVQPFDIFYRVEYRTQVGGGNADWIAPPVFERSWLKVRPMYGGRYLQINERFAFDGADSGLGYTINPPGGAGGLGGTTGGGGTGGGIGTTTIGYLSPSTLEAGSTLNVMYSWLASQVTTQLAGPEIGFRLDLGRERFNIYTTTKFGLLVNESTRKLAGDNIGDAYYPATNGTLGANTASVMPRNLPGVTAFSSTNTNTFVSPMFEQGIFGQANLFQFVPLLNKSRLLNGAQFQAGFTAIYVGNMYRPSNDISWQAFPVNPQIMNQRGTFFTSNVSLGVQWTY